VLAERRETGQTLVRPELCVLLAYSKLGLKTALLEGTLPDDPVAESYLIGYFPSAANLAAGHQNLESHRLRREIIASQLTNDLVDLMGATFASRVMRDTGSSSEQVVMAWLVASRLADHRALLSQMTEQRGAVDARVASRWLLGLARVLERIARWVLRNIEPEESPATVVGVRLDGLSVLRDAFADCVAGEERELFEQRVAEIEGLGADEAFSKSLITLRFLDQLLEILEIARRTGSDPVATARAYYEVSHLLHVPWLRRSTFAIARAGQWEHRAAQHLSEDLSRAHRKVVVEVVGADGGNERRLHEHDVERFRGIVDELRKEGEAAGLAALSVAVRELSMLADRTARHAPSERRQ
jgi:glutamate dehydrogenase